MMDCVNMYPGDTQSFDGELQHFTVSKVDMHMMNFSRDIFSVPNKKTFNNQRSNGIADTKGWMQYLNNLQLQNIKYQQDNILSRKAYKQQINGIVTLFGAFRNQFDLKFVIKKT